MKLSVRLRDFLLKRYKRFKKLHMPHLRQNNGSLVPNAVQQEIILAQKIEETMKLGYSYEVAYAIVSKMRIQELFERDVKIER